MQFIINKIKKVKSKKGQQMVEMAVVLPLLILCLGIIITGGQLIFGKMVCQMSAYEGARKAVVIKNPSQAKSIANQTSKEMLKNGIGLNNEKITFNIEGDWKKGSYLNYTVSSNVKTLFPVLDTNFKLHSQTPVKGKIKMMIERN